MALEEKDQEENKGSGLKITEEKMSSSDIDRLIEEGIAKKLASLNIAPPQVQGGGIDQGTMLSLIEAIKGTTSESNGQFQFNTAHTESEVDLDDVLDQKDWTIFVSHRVGYVIADDKRHGKNIRAPFNLIEFKYNNTKRVTNGKETELFHISTYICKSKRENKWLREHSAFGTMFFDKISGALNVNAKKAARLMKVMTGLRNYGQAELVMLARQNGIELVDDLNIMRASIATVMVENQLKQEEKATEMVLRETKIESELLSK